MSYLYRCKKKGCDTRRSLPRLHTDYVRLPKCHTCGELLTYRDVWQERKNRGKENLCYCDGLHFTPHRIASSVWCHEHATGPQESDYQDRYGL